MKKLVLSIIFLLGFSTTSYANGSAGFTVSLADVNSTVTDDIDSNGTTDTTRNLSNDVAFASIFFEKAVNDNMSVGIDFIPFEAEFESRSTTQSSIKEKGSSTTTGTNKGTADVSNHLTLYVQPTKVLDDGSKLFATLGYVKADVETLVQSVSSTNKTVDQTLEGFKIGVGTKRDIGANGIFKIELSRTDYDDISATTSNSTKVTADIDATVLSVSVGKSF